MIDRLIRRAKRTPYFHLNGYMERWWLVPYREVIKRPLLGMLPDGGAIAVGWNTDGTGPVSFWRPPLAWLLQHFGIAVRIHHILSSDAGRDPHDHPWPYLTIILHGGYYENRYDDGGLPVSSEWHGPGSVLLRRANSWHMLVLPPNTTCWTLFITGRKAQTWGFNVKGVKVPYKQYLNGRRERE